jgi:hypothetical protein
MDPDVEPHARGEGARQRAEQRAAAEARVKRGEDRAG